MNWNIFDIQKLLANDQREITRMYAIIHPWILFKTGGNEEMANDIFIKLLNKLPKYDSKRSKFHNFVYILVVNACKDAFKKEKKEKEKNLIDRKDVEMLVIHEDEVYSEEEQLSGVLKNALNELSDAHLAFLLTYINSTEKKKTADRVKFFKIKKILKNKLNE